MEKVYQLAANIRQFLTHPKNFHFESENGMDVIGSIGSDWMARESGKSQADDQLLRAWRDYLEENLKAGLGLESDFTLGPRTRFVLPANSAHTVTEIESFARRALDTFLNRRQ
jgi:hypothetical protein